MADTWTPISGYTPQDYTDTAIFEVNADTKKIALITGQALVAGEENSQYIKFLMPRYWDGIDIKDKAFYVEYALAGQYYGKTAAVNAEYNTEQIRFGWIVPKEACCISGTLLFILRIESTDYILKTQIAEHPVFRSVNVEDVVPEPTKEAWYRDFAARVEVAIDEAEAALAQAQQAVVSAETAAQNAQAAEDNAEAAAASAQVRYGSPLVAQTVAEMVDENRVYVYVGSESGYTNGNWYYYDGSAWTSGGVYNSSAVNTDTTLTQSGMAADAKATGDKINSIVNSAYVADSVSGSVAHFTDGADDIPMKSIKVNIEPVQSGSGDPSPSNVRAISGWDGVKVIRTRKNLIPYPYRSVDGTYQNVTRVTNADGSVTFNGIASANSYFNFVTEVDNFSFKAGSYILSANTVPNDCLISVNVQVNGVNKYNANLTAGNTSVVFTPQEDGLLRCYITVKSGATVNDWTVYPMLRLASDTDDTYELYNDETYEVSLASAGTVYGGTLDVSSGVLTVDRKGVLMETLTWNRTTSYANPVFYSNVSDKAVSYEKTLCSILHNLDTPNVISAQGFANRANDGDYACSNGNAQIYARLDSATTVQGFVTAVTGQTIIYPLATPITYNLTPTEVKSLLGINNVWSDAGDVTAEYRADTKLYIKRLTDSDTDMRADANITSGQYFMVGNDLYRATVNIASGAQVIVGTNATKVSLSEALNEINA